MHAQIASEDHEFKLEEVLENINTKLVRRHPHVFGDVRVDSAEEVVHNWEQIKKTERALEASVLESVPRQMPSLAYSQEIQRRAAETGFDWDNIEGVLDKLTEEVREFQHSATREEKEDEFGDVFFTLVNVSRRMGIDPESALRKANQKFYSRFILMEELCHKRGLKFDQLNFEEKNGLWEEAKFTRK